MKPIKVLDLSEVFRLKLEKGYHNGPTHSFHIRCIQLVLNLGHNPLYRHFYKCLYIEMLKKILVY